VFYVDVAYVCNGFHVFSVVFVSYSDACFICLLLYVASVASGCFKSRLGVAHGMHMENRRVHERSLCRRRPSGTVQASDVQATWAPRGRVKQGRNGLQLWASGRPGASSTII
jgi:hypothetical protein